MNNTTTHSHDTSVTEATASINDWVPVPRFCELFPHIPEKTIRWQLTKRHANGLAPHVLLMGKRRYISITGYAQWLSEGPRH
jgi:hypothetical protein